MLTHEIPVEIDTETYAWLLEQCRPELPCEPAVLAGADIWPLAKRGESVSIGEARSKMQTSIAGFLHRTASHLAATIRAFGDDHEKLAKAAVSMNDLLATLLPLNWDILIPQLAPPLRVAARTSGAAALAELHVDNESMLSDVNQVAAEWADMRAAEMVGRKYVKGKLVDNPNAEWVISDYTRDQIKSIITDAFKAKTSMRDLAAEVEQAGVFSESRAEMIAKTEIINAENQGNLLGWKHSNLVEMVDIDLSADHDDSSECDCSEISEAGPYPIDDVPRLGRHPRCMCSYSVAQLAGQVTPEVDEE